MASEGTGNDGIAAGGGDGGVRAEVGALPDIGRREAGGWLVPAAAALAIAALPLVLSPYGQDVVVRIAIYAIFALSLELLVGATGLVSLGHAAFLGIGAYAHVFFVHDWHLPWVVSVALAAAVLGGFGSIPGALVGGITIGLIELFSGAYLPQGFKDVAAYVVLLIVLAVRPQGMFGAIVRKKV